MLHRHNVLFGLIFSLLMIIFQFTLLKVTLLLLCPAVCRGHAKARGAGPVLGAMIAQETHTCLSACTDGLNKENFDMPLRAATLILFCEEKMH